MTQLDTTLRRARDLTHLTAALIGGIALCASSCGASQPAPGPNAGGAAALQRALDGADFVWVSAECVDGALDLARVGFERTLHSDVVGSSVRFTYDTRLAQPACVSTEVWSLEPDVGGEWRFSQEADVALPAKTSCGASDAALKRGEIHVNGETLEALLFNSAWCRGYDARFVYRRAPKQALTRDAIIRRYAAHWNRRDAHAVAALFADSGMLIEPFSRSSDALPVRHAHRAGIEAWLRGAFASTPWLALQLTDIEPLEDQGQMLALWRYFDPRLAEPLAGRNLFVLAGGEIFATELQLVSEPVPARSASNTP